jgi:hypothetical protein
MATSSGKIDFDLVARSTSRHSDNGDERGSIYGQTMEPPAPMLSPATRQTLMEMSEAEHRSSNQSFLKGVLADVTEAEHQMLLDVSEAMNQAPYSVLSTTRGEKVHRLFRTMGLRHLVVTDEVNEVSSPHPPPPPCQRGG